MKTAIITGASSGIGRVISKHLRARNWQVVGPTHSELDLADLTQTAKAAHKLAGEYMQIDALIHGAGIWHDANQALASRDLEDFSPTQIADTMNVGVTGFMIIAAVLLPRLAKDGVVIGVSGTFESGASGWLPYYTSKRALEDFLVGLAHDYPTGPRIFGVSPSDTATEAYHKFFPEDAATAQSPEAVADLVAKLADDELMYRSGEIIKIKVAKHASGYHR